jgi:3-hydroxyisobutyrate dehydrogenase-like beta-hydroxyacid dehydrogenase
VGTLTIMVGGDEAAYARVEPLLRELGSPTRIGDNGHLPDDAWFNVGLMQKDVALALDTARQLDVPLPSAAAADQLLTVARALGYERRDLASLYEVLARVAGDST